MFAGPGVPALVGWPEQALGGLWDALQLDVYTFLLVVVRMSGLMTTGPVLMHPSIPLNVRILLVLCLGLLITPHLHALRAPAADVVPADDLVRPERMGEGVVPVAAQGARETVSAAEPPALVLPGSVPELGVIVAGELGLGMVLGLGMAAVLSALQLAGQLVDQQTGMGLGEVFNPDLGTSTSMSGDFLFLLGSVVFLTANGHLLVLAALLDTFRVLPLGSQGWMGAPVVELLSALVGQSLELALQVAGPILATLLAVGLSMGILAHSAPQLNLFAIGFPVRALVGFVILALAVSGLAVHVAEAVPTVIDLLRGTLTGLPPRTG